MMIKTRLLIYYIAHPIGWILLALGAGTSLYGLADTIRLLGREDLAIAYGRGVPSLVVFLLSCSYFIIWLKKGFSLRTMVMYLGSYLLLGLLFNMLVGMIYKGFPPSTPDEARTAIITSYLILTAASAIAILGIFWAARQGHIWHNKWFVVEAPRTKVRGIFLM